MKRTGVRLSSLADRHDLYQKSVQSPEHEAWFFNRIYRATYKRSPVLLREDFCGTALVCCEWVKNKKDRRAYGVDIDPPTLDWGREHNVSKLSEKARERVSLVVGDARYIILRRMQDEEQRKRFLEEIRVLKISDPIPNDLCAVRKDFPEETWQRFLASLQRFIETENGKSALFDLLAGVSVAATDDAAFDDFRDALVTAGIEAEGLVRAAEEKHEERRTSEEGGN